MGCERPVYDGQLSFRELAWRTAISPSWRWMCSPVAQPYATASFQTLTEGMVALHSGGRTVPGALVWLCRAV